MSAVYRRYDPGDTVIAIPPIDVLQVDPMTPLRQGRVVRATLVENESTGGVSRRETYHVYLNAELTDEMLPPTSAWWSSSSRTCEYQVADLHHDRVVAEVTRLKRVRDVLPNVLAFERRRAPEYEQNLTPHMELRLVRDLLRARGHTLDPEDTYTWKRGDDVWMLTVFPGDRLSLYGRHEVIQHTDPKKAMVAAWLTRFWKLELQVASMLEPVEVPSAS